MNPFLLTPRERLKHWKEFRIGLTDRPDAEKFAEVARYWALAPLQRYAYDAHDPSSWPTMWEMISAGDWCDHSVAVGMEATLRLAGYPAEHLKLVLINDRDISEIKFVLQIADKLWLNYNYGIVADVPQTDRTVMCAWQFDGKRFVSVSA